MPKGLKVRKLNHGTPNTANHQNYKRTATKISKYFIPVENTDKAVESPYKYLITSKDDIIPIDIDNDCDDFKSPKPIRIAKVFEISKQTITTQDKKAKSNKPKSKSKNSMPRKKGLQTDLTKLFTKSAKDDNSVNREHLQMAIALSKSEMQNADQEELVCSGESDLTPKVSSQEKNTRLRATLEQFGFNMPSKYKNGQLKNATTETNKRKKSKFKYITPVLCTRTEAERLELVANNIALLINNKTTVTSEERETWRLSATSDLKNYYIAESNIFQMNAACLSNEEYYVHSLNVPHSDYVPGCLLKKWGDILGREKSPERQDVNTFIEMEQTEKSPHSKYLYEINSPENQCKNTSTSEPKSICIKPNNEVSDLNDLDLQSDINDDKYSSTVNVNAPVIPTGEYRHSNCPQLLSPDLFCSEDEDLPHENGLNEIDTNAGSISNISHIDKLPNLNQSINIDFDNHGKEKDRNASLTECDSVINITISQIEILKPTSVDTYFESMHLKKLEKILGPSNLNSTNVDDNPRYSKEQYNNSVKLEELTFTNKDTIPADVSNADDKLIDLTYSTDSDCHIIEDQKENACTISKTNLKRFDSFNSTMSVDSNISHTSDTNIIISDEELNYSTNNSISFRKQKRKTILKIENVESRYMNVSPLNNVNTNTLDSPLNTNDISSIDKSDIFNCNSPAPKREDTDNYNSILASLDDITAKYIKESQEAEKCINNTSLLKNTTINQDINVTKYPDIQNVQCSGSNVMDSFNSITLENKFEDDNQKSPTSAKNDLTSDVLILINETPKNDHLIIKTDNITPIPNYTDMDTPKIADALRKFGLKPLKRKRGVQLLQYIYDVTHPEVPEKKSSENEDDLCKNLGVKRIKSDISKPSAADTTPSSEAIDIVGDIIDEREFVHGLIIEQKKSAKLSTCPVPLNIAWHNLLAANSFIRESMLMYEPLEVERLYAMLKAQGLKYNVQDVITFLDRKCITIRTKQNTGKKKIITM